MSENRRVVKAAGIVGGATLLSRILGYVRDMVMAGFFGTGLCSDAFIAAFRIPNLMRRLFAEGSLSVSFVPVFTDYLSGRGRREAFRMAGSAVRFLSVILVVVAVLGIFLSPLIIHAVAPGFSQNAEAFKLAVVLTKIMFPYVFFICLVALCMGILNALGHFAAPALAPVFLNIAMIGALLGASFFSEDLVFRVKALAAGVVLGGVIQLGFQIPYLIKNGFYFWKKGPLIHPGLKKVGVLMLPAVLGAAVYQVNVVVGTILASLLGQGSISCLYYADRLVQFPLGIFAISMGTAVLPSLSRQASANDMKGLKQTFAYGLRLIFFITLPAMVGLVVLREPVVRILFKRGAFDMEAVRLTSNALLCYVFGLWSISAVRVTVPVFYALKDAKTPVRVAMVAIAANIILSLTLMGPLKYAGLALATSLASMINLMFLLFLLRRKIGSFYGGKIVVSLVKSALASVVMGACVRGLALYLIPAYNSSVFYTVVGLVLSISLGVIIYACFSWLIKSAELKSVLILLRRGKA